MNNERTIVEYSKNEIDNIEDEKEIILRQISINVRNKISEIHDNQEKCASEIVNEFRNRKIINIMVTALTQSGKTGTMIALIKNYIINKENKIPLENIFIITGLSSKEWTEQTVKRMPNGIQNIYHRDNLKKYGDFIKKIKDKENILIIIDEVQIAAKDNQSIYKCFDELGFLNKNYLLNKDIKIVEFSATPDGTIYDVYKWNDNSCIVKMLPGLGYTSLFDLMDPSKWDYPRVYQYKDLCCYKNFYGEPKYDEKRAKKILLK